MRSMGGSSPPLVQSFYAEKGAQHCYYPFATYQTLHSVLQSIGITLGWSRPGSFHNFKAAVVAIIPSLLREKE